jgi:hypothetical protein
MSPQMARPRSVQSVVECLIAELQAPHADASVANVRRNFSSILDSLDPIIIRGEAALSAAAWRL